VVRETVKAFRFHFRLPLFFVCSSQLAHQKSAARAMSVQYALAVQECEFVEQDVECTLTSVRDSQAQLSGESGICDSHFSIFSLPACLIAIVALQREAIDLVAMCAQSEPVVRTKLLQKVYVRALQCLLHHNNDTH
jgi:hypothetical protein